LKSAEDGLNSEMMSLDKRFQVAAWMTAVQPPREQSREEEVGGELVQEKSLPAASCEVDLSP